MHETIERRFGEIFKKARAEKKISIVRAESDTKIRSKFIEAIEDENFAFLPNPVVGKGFVKLYSEYLGLDSSLMVEKFLKMLGDEKPTEINPNAMFFWVDSSASGVKVPLKFALPAALAAILFIALYFGFGHPRLGADVSSTSSPPAQTLDAPEKVLLSAEFVDRTWISVELDGKSAFTGVVGQGQKMFWEADKRIKIKAGNGGGVKVAVNEKPIGLLGEAGAAVEKEFTR